MRTALITTASLFGLIVGYFLLWPVPINPVSWQAPLDRGYVDPFERNDLLAPVTGISLGTHSGPEDATVGGDGRLYLTTDSGNVIRLQNRGVSLFAAVGGRPLGIERDGEGFLIVANAELGLQRVSGDGTTEIMLDNIDDVPLTNANNLGIGASGTIYFSQSSSKFTSADFGGSYDASLLDILEHGGHGSVYAYDPESGEIERLLTNLNYANGVAVSDAEDFILVAETGHYRILKHWLQGEKQGTTEVLIENLPGFPDNIKNGLNGRFWVGLVAPRNDLVDQLSDKPLLRKMVQRLPANLRPKATPSSHVIAINQEGQVLMNLHDPNARFPSLTGVLETRDSLFLTSLFGGELSRLKKRDL